MYLYQIVDYLKEASAYWKEVAPIESPTINNYLGSDEFGPLDPVPPGSIYAEYLGYWNSMRVVEETYPGIYRAFPIDPFYRTLGEVSGYINMKIRIVVPNDPGVSEILPGDDYRNFFSPWIVGLPDYALLFEVGEFGGTTPTETFNNLIETLQHCKEGDLARLESFEFNLGPSFNRKNTYLTFGKPPITILDPENQNWNKDYMINKMYLLIVLDFYGWDIQGINI